MTLMESVPVDRQSADQLRSVFRGEVVTPDDVSYAEHRKVWNGSINRRPSLIARCAGVSDVRAAVRFARDRHLLVSVRSGGHSFPGLSVCDGGMVLDLGLMKGVRVDPRQQRVRAQAGVLLGELDQETQSFGYAVPAGIVTHTGLAGLTLGGGIGWIMRKYGLTIDSLTSVDVVTAEGELVTANHRENAELFWGVRGGGGNFGVVTEFEFRMHRLGPDVVAGPVFWPAEQTREVLQFYRDWVLDCPDELMTIVVQRQAPDLPVVPRELVGRLVIGVVACYAGDIAEGERVVQPLKGFGSPVLDLCVRKPYLAHQKMFDPSFRHGHWYYVRSCDVAALTDDVIDVMTEYGQQIASPITSIALWQMGGAVARVDEGSTAFNGRHTGFTFNINGNSETADGFDDQRRWARRYWDSLAPHHTGVYVNFLMEEGEERIRQAYGIEKYNRLKALKRRYDPTNFFRLNQNISPE